MFKKTIPIFALAQSAEAFRQRSIPACNTYDGCKKDTAASLDYNDVVTQHSSFQDHERVNRVIDNFVPNAYGLHAQTRSIPACNTYDGCKKASAAKPWADTSPTTPNWGQMNEDWQADAGMQVPYSLYQSRSVPACNSLGCKTQSVVHPPTDTIPFEPSLWGKNNQHWQPDDQWLSQQRSIPACNTYDGCKKASSAKPWADTSPTTPNWGQMNEDWQADAGMQVPYSFVQLESRPACTSFECQTGTAAFDFAPPDKKIKDYDVPNFGEDKEIIAAKQHIAEAEKTLGTWDLKPYTKPDHPIDYKVPNFGMDVDIVDSIASEKSTSDTLDHKWEIKLD